jgi:hypothetical protein
MKLNITLRITVVWIVKRGDLLYVQATWHRIYIYNIPVSKPVNICVWNLRFSWPWRFSWSCCVCHPDDEVGADLPVRTTLRVKFSSCFGIWFPLAEIVVISTERIKIMWSEMFRSETKDLKCSCKRCLCLRNADNGIGDVALSLSVWILTILWRIDNVFNKRLGKLFFPLLARL